jgi:cell division protein FtsB
MRLITVVLALLLIGLQYRLWLAPGGIPTLWQLQSQLQAQTRQNQQLAERNQVLDAQVQDLKQGLDVVEERARHDLGMIKQGETFYHIIGDQ